MSAPYGLIKIANEIAADIANESNALRLKREDLKKQIAEIEGQLSSSVDANSRNSNYRSITTLKGRDHCPNCWVRGLNKSPLEAVSRDDEEEKNQTRKF